jgi:TatD DNase family protein
VAAPLIDSHCHLDIGAFDADLDAVLARAKEAGLVHLITVGAGRGEAGPERAVDLARAHPDFVSATAGIHPHDARVATDDELAGLAFWARLPEVVAIGETGLDFHYDMSLREDQERAFRAQIALARQVRKPVVVHTRSAPERTLSILREEMAGDVGGVIHCFSEDVPFARAALDIGFVSSFSGLVTFPKARGVLEAALAQPLDAILVETDAPFLAPVPRRGKRNEPSYVAHTAAFIARARGIDEDAFRAIVTENARRVFALPPARY